MMNDKNSFLQVPGFKPMSRMSGRAALTLTAFRHFQRSPVLKLLANPLRDLATYSSKSLLSTNIINKHIKFYYFFCLRSQRRHHLARDPNF